jgi:signal transduction histidine kinase
MLIGILTFILISIVMLALPLEQAGIIILICALCLVGGMIIVCYRYLKEQNSIIEDAAMQISAFMAEQKYAPIACDEEGALYRLFQNINVLVSTLHAHAQKEGQGKEFLKNTISDISHQLKTPLAALNIYNGIIQGEADVNSSIQEFAALSEQELDRMETLVQNLLKITRLDAGAILFHKKWEDVSAIMSDVEKHFRFRGKQEGKELLFIGNTMPLFCDRDWLIEAIDNMVKNALDHTKKGDYVHVQWEQLISIVQIRISDNGSGIHPEDYYHIFKRFYRSRFSKDTDGIGLGLPLAKSIISSHDGTIEVNSTLGSGTTFTINLVIPTKL